MAQWSQVQPRMHAAEESRAWIIYIIPYAFWFSMTVELNPAFDISYYAPFTFLSKILFLDFSQI